MRLIVLIFISLFISLPVLGQWYETQGQAFIKNGDEKEARTKAMENALKKALLVAGASVSSVQQVVNGLITQDEINIRATGSVNSFELVSESYQDNMVSVVIRADIFPQEKQCFSADYRKSMLITKSQLLDREQANIGGIYNLDKILVKRFANKLNQQGVYLDTKLALQHNSTFARLKHSLNEEKIKSLTQSLADMSDAQYVMYSIIEDISFANEKNNGWKFWQEDEFNRHFKFAIYIYNGSSGELAFSKQYQHAAPWRYSKRTQVDLNSNSFWQSDYGDMIEQTLAQTITDIDETMMCQPTRGKILQVTGNQVKFSLGTRHGVKIGDEFSLLHLNNFTANNGNSYAAYNISNFKVKVTQVMSESATAITTNGSLIDSIQINDLAVRY